MGKVDELKAKNENLFERNTILLNENERLKKENADLRDNYDQFKASAIPEIERLQKENAELRNNGFTVSAMTEQQLKAALEKGEQLEKENAELKHNKKTVAHLADCLEEKMKERIEELETRCNELFLQNNEFAERLEKSIEIIKGLLSCCRNYPQENAEKMKQAEQFLKEMKNEKRRNKNDIYTENY